jgi:hypothetical protein
LRSLHSRAIGDHLDARVHAEAHQGDAPDHDAHANGYERLHHVPGYSEPLQE